MLQGAVVALPAVVGPDVEQQLVGEPRGQAGPEHQAALIGDLVFPGEQTAAIAIVVECRCRQLDAKPVIDQRLPMAELQAAYARMGSRQVMGKLLLVNA